MVTVKGSGRERGHRSGEEGRGDSSVTEDYEGLWWLKVGGPKPGHRGRRTLPEGYWSTSSPETPTVQVPLQRGRDW